MTVELLECTFSDTARASDFVLPSATEVKAEWRFLTEQSYQARREVLEFRVRETDSLKRNHGSVSSVLQEDTGGKRSDSAVSNRYCAREWSLLHKFPS